MFKSMSFLQKSVIRHYHSRDKGFKPLIFKGLSQVCDNTRSRKIRFLLEAPIKTIWLPVISLTVILIALAYPIRSDGIYDVPKLTPEKIVNRSFDNGERLEYEFTWNGLSCARAVMTAKESKYNNRDVFLLRTEAETIGIAHRAWKMNDWGESIVLTDTLKPFKFIMHQEEAGDLRHSTVIFDHSTGIAKVTRIHKEKTKQFEIPFIDAYDPLSMVYMMRCLKYKVGETKVIEIIDSNHRYRVSLNVLAAEMITIGSGNYSTYKIQPGFTEIPKPKNPREKVLYRASLWINMEPPYQLLKLKSKVFVGNVHGELVNFSSNP